MKTVLKHGACCCTLVFLFIFNCLSAKTWQVPGDFSTIQAAINVAQEGDTVMVAPGIYFENLQLRGRNIVLTSRFHLERDASLIEKTIVDGSQPAHPDTASCLLIWKHEAGTTVVEGFTFRGGRGTVWLDPAGAGTFREGGGILTEFSSPVIRHNIIRDNVIPAGPVTGIVSTGGGGIRCGEGAPRIENNRIVFNRADGYGGGVVLNYCPNAHVRNNIIAHNYGGKDYSGAGFWATGASQSTIVKFYNNVVAYNTTPPGPQPYGGKAGGIFVFSIKLEATGNIIRANQQPSGKQALASGGVLDMRYNCADESYPGTGNFVADPIFADTTSFLLSPGSPCIDAGTFAYLQNDLTINGLQALWPAKGKVRNDIGAYGGPFIWNPACTGRYALAGIFTKVTNSPVVSRNGDSRSVNWIDIDGDRDLDLMITNGPEQGENNFLYKNDGSGGFTAVSGDPIVQDGEASDGATWADFDNDGDNDCYVVNWYGHNNLFYKNNGNGTFEQVTTGPLPTDGGYSETASWGDYDNDGLLDLYATNSGGTLRNFLYRNTGNGEFEKITSGPPATDANASRSVNWTDFDLDGDIDLFVTNENNQNENLYRNDGNGQFTKISAGPLVNDGRKTMSSSWGDYDNDGDLDVFLANDQATDALFENEGAGNFSKVTTGPIVTTAGNTFGSNWADVDNDADLDLFVTNAFWGGPWRNYLFLNDGQGNFTRDNTEVVSMDEGWSYGNAFGDFDRDGDLDLAVANCLNANQKDYLYENHSAETNKHWLVVECIGTVSNRSAIGAKIWIEATINGVLVTQLREISAQSGYCGQSQLPAHFGLGSASQIQNLRVLWPSGLEEIYGQVFADQYVTLREGQGIVGIDAPVLRPDFSVKAPRPNPFRDTVTFDFSLEKNSALSIEIVDASGSSVRLFSPRDFAAGEHQFVWDGKNAAGESVKSGVYTVVFGKNGGRLAQTVIKVF